jgi:hypothetical protein
LHFSHNLLPDCTAMSMGEEQGLVLVLFLSLPR